MGSRNGNTLSPYGQDGRPVVVSTRAVRRRRRRNREAMHAVYAAGKRST